MPCQLPAVSLIQTDLLHRARYSNISQTWQLGLRFNNTSLRRCRCPCGIDERFIAELASPKSRAAAITVSPVPMAALPEHVGRPIISPSLPLLCTLNRGLNFWVMSGRGQERGNGSKAKSSLYREPCGEHLSIFIGCAYDR